MPSPGRPYCYHVFFWDSATASGRGVSLHYAVVDMRRNGGRGDVVERSAPLAYTQTPHLTAVRHGNNRDFWVLSRHDDGQGFVAVPLTPQGALAPVVSLAGQAQYVGSFELQASADGRHLVTGGVTVEGRTASRPNGTVSGNVCVYDFDNHTGTITQERVVRRVALAGYGPANSRQPPVLVPWFLSAATFSPDGSKLYTTEADSTAGMLGSRRISDIWQYDLRQPDPAATRFLVSNVPTPAPAIEDTVIVPGL